MKDKSINIISVFLAIFTLAVLLGNAATPIQAQSDDHVVYLPLVINGSSGSVSQCPRNTQEQALADLFENDPGQQRSTIICDPILTKVAQERALDMATRGYFSHSNPDGLGPNYLVQQAGYQLPSFYNQSLIGNNIESIGGGYPSANAVWTGWMSSTGHRTHLLGTISFYAEQVDVGIGYAYDPNSQYGHYWVVITARH